MSTFVLNSAHCPRCRACWHAGETCDCTHQPVSNRGCRDPGKPGATRGYSGSRRPGYFGASSGRSDARRPAGNGWDPDPDLLPLPEPVIANAVPVDPDPDGPLHLPPGLV